MVTNGSSKHVYVMFKGRIYMAYITCMHLMCMHFQKVLLYCALNVATQNMWQSRTEIEYCSVMYFKHNSEAHH